ncbi:polyprenyl synthetase family protein [Robertkochia marina]|uniref:Polyprenyl synthetase family protein n=1 Tax=Robertkochia marina TaxID=1227945 RepID=A0A4V3UYC2_9FLAO|nr:polyprenyl synthetase family protein [Robertkochia marina]THD69118.1 polyprenyl synthetase family protein [Robertkochia marina]TRZ47623.1 polyprenyl synthetase family protein [Robertkochia marina]
MKSIEAYREVFSEYLNSKISRKEPINLYDPMNYIMNLGGKRLRPTLTLVTADLFGGNHRHALDAALAVEIFHNFSLVHDDIMDDAPLRRGHATVHEKWDVNTAILSGDAMLILAYQLFESYEPETFQKLAKLFSKTAIEVCEGQQYDVDFENRDDVTIDEYLKMITYKTAVLLGASLKMGAIIAGASDREAQAIYDFGINLGIAFQIMDDYLDAFGDQASFGKQVGGDIIENKKTFLYLKTLEHLSPADAKQLTDLYSITPEDPEDKVRSVKELVVSSGAADLTQQAIEKYTNKALDILNSLERSEAEKTILKGFAHQLMRRTT